MAKIGVFLGSHNGHQCYTNAVLLLGQEVAARGHVLVCGASGSGTMGSLIESALNAGGAVIGVLPSKVNSNEVPHPDLIQIHKVPTVSDRKKEIRELSDIIITLPGGIGTLDEFFEAYTLKKSNLFNKPIGLLNINGFYNSLIAQIGVIINEGFAKEKHRELFSHSSDATALLDSLLSKIEANKIKTTHNI